MYLSVFHHPEALKAELSFIRILNCIFLSCIWIEMMKYIWYKKWFLTFKLHVVRSGAPTVPECNTTVIKTVCQINVSANYKQKSLSYVLKTLICLQHLYYFISMCLSVFPVICSGLCGILTTKQTESEYFLRRAWCHLNVWKAPFCFLTVDTRQTN